MGGALAGCRPIDRFKVSTEALQRVGERIAADVLEGIGAANAGRSRAATVMLRRALERACNAAGADARTLSLKIQQLEKQGILTAVQASSAHVIRAFANEYGAHPDDDYLDEVNDEEIEAAVKVTMAVIEGLARRSTGH